MNILVAGGAGFVGSHLVDRLVEQGHTVAVADNFITGSCDNLEQHARSAAVSIHNVDVTEKEAVAAIPGSFDQVYHLASPASPVDYAKYPLETLLVNSMGTLHLLERAAADGARFVMTSTSEVYGDPQIHPQPEHYWGHVNPIGPRSCYDEGKRYAESLAVHFSQQRGLNIRIARLFNTYGPRIGFNDGRVVPNFIVQALRGEPLTVYGDGSQTRSLCYVADTVEALIRLMETEGIDGEVVNIGNPDEYTMLELASEILKVVGGNSAIEHRPLPVDDPTRRRPSIEKAQRLLGWNPATTLAEGLDMTVEFFRVVLASQVGATR